MAVPKNNAELGALETFRPIVQDLQFGDGVLMRFLRARDLDMVKAEDMLRKFIIWRKSALCNQYLTWTVPLDIYQFDVYLTGFDDEGRPVLWAPYGLWPSVRDLMDRGMTDDILKYCGKMMEKLHQLLLRTKHQQLVVLVDSEGVTFSKVFYEARCWKGFTTLMGLLNEYERNFPELLHKAFLFNTPLAFMWGWKFLSHCFSQYTLSKVNIFGAGKDAKLEWEIAMRSNLPERAIPMQYGGQNPTPLNINGDLIQAWEEFCMERK